MNQITGNTVDVEIISLENYLLSEVKRLLDRVQYLENQNNELKKKISLSNNKDVVTITHAQIGRVRRAIARVPVPSSLREWLHTTKMTKDVFMLCVENLAENKEINKESIEFLKSIKK